MPNIYDRLKAGTTPLMAKFKNPVQGSYESPVRTPDGGGGYTTAWVDQGNINIIILPKIPKQNIEAGRLESQVTQTIYVLYDDGLNITAKSRIVFKGRYFLIEGDPVNIAEGDMWIKLTCTEGVAT